MKGNQCGACVHYLKLRQLEGNGGLCTYYDGRCDTDFKRCVKFKRIKFHRNANKSVFEQLEKE